MKTQSHARKLLDKLNAQYDQDTGEQIMSPQEVRDVLNKKSNDDVIMRLKNGDYAIGFVDVISSQAVRIETPEGLSKVIKLKDVATAKYRNTHR